MDNVNFEAKTNWVQDETVYPADANRWEKGIKDCANLVNDHNEKIPLMNNEIDKKLNKTGDTMTGPLIMEIGSNGIKLKAPDIEGGYVGGNASLTDEQKDILYRFFYKYPTSKNNNPLKSGESYRLYQGHYISDLNLKVISIGWINTSNEYCDYNFSGAFKSSTTASNMWWNDPTDWGIASPIDLNMVVTQVDAPTSYIDPQTNIYYNIIANNQFIAINNKNNQGIFIPLNYKGKPRYFDNTSNYPILPPVGSLIMGPIPEAKTPEGYLLCNGQAVSRTTYADLFAILGTNFGAGNGSTTFNVPNYRDCFLRGVGDHHTDFYSKQMSGIPNHYHSLHGQNNYSGFSNNAFGNGQQNTATLSNVISGAQGSSIYQDNLNEVRPTNYAVHFYIKY